MGPVEIVKSIQANFDAFKSAQADADKKIQAHVEAVEKNLSAEAKEALAQSKAAVEKVTGLADRLLEAEQKLVAGVNRGEKSPESLGVFVINSDQFKQFQSGGASKVRIEANTITGQEGSPAENSNVLVPANRVPGIIPGGFRALRVRDVIPAGTTTSNAVEYTRELAFTNSSAETAEGGQKPESSLTFELATANIRTIAHFIKVSRQVLDDAPALSSYINIRLTHGVNQREDAQFLNGNGTGQNISGITKSGNYTAFTPGVGDTALDSLNKAKYLIEAADYAATAIIINPADWGAIERLKDGQDRYVIGNPFGAITPVLWGLPVVTSNAMTSGKLLVGAFDIAFMIWDRQQTVVELSESDDDNFQKNLITVRAEKRSALSSNRPASVLYGDLID